MSIGHSGGADEEEVCRVDLNGKPKGDGVAVGDIAEDVHAHNLVAGTKEQKLMALAQMTMEQRVAAQEAYIRAFIEATGENIEDLELAERMVKTDAGSMETSWFLRRKEALRGAGASRPSSIVVAK